MILSCTLKLRKVYRHIWLVELFVGGGNATSPFKQGGRVMARAYVLIETGIGKAFSVVQALRQVPGVRSADAITGPYDVMAIIEAEDPGAIGQIVMRQLHSKEGVNRTHSCFVVH